MKTSSIFVLTICCLTFMLFTCKNNSAVFQNENQHFEVTNENETISNYNSHCSGCHGQNLSSFIERKWVYGNSPEAILKSIRVGYQKNGMPAYANTFSEKELKDLTNYILRETEGKTKNQLATNHSNSSDLITSKELNFRIETLTDKIKGIPWGMQQLPNGDFLITERGGKLYRLDSSRTLIEITNVPSVVAKSQGGLLDIELHPNFNNNSLLYLSYSGTNPKNTNEQSTVVVSAKLSGNQLKDVKEIFVALPYLSTAHHYGSRLLFDTNGYLYVSVGDRGYRDEYPQSLSNALGKIHRILDNGDIPKDNPFYNMDDAVSSIYTYGIRNPQGLTLHPITGEIWEGEHGPRGGDEINIIEAGKNYGWPVISYGINYNGTTMTPYTEKEGMEQPVHYWNPSIAPCGMTFLSSNYYGSWKNDLFVSSLKFEYLHRLKMDGNKVVGEEELLKDIGRVRDVYNGNDGYLYLLVQNPGRLIRLLPEQ